MSASIMQLIGRGGGGGGGGGIGCSFANYVNLCDFTQCELFWGRNYLINRNCSRDVSVGTVTRPRGGRSGIRIPPWA